MPAAPAAPAAPAPTPDVPRHVADLSDIQRCADSKKDNLMDRTEVNTTSWIAFRFQFYMALITRCNIWTQLSTLAPFTNAAPCVLDRYDAGKNSSADNCSNGPAPAPTRTVGRGLLLPSPPPHFRLIPPAHQHRGQGARLKAPPSVDAS